MPRKPSTHHAPGRAALAERPPPRAVILDLALMMGDDRAWRKWLSGLIAGLGLASTTAGLFQVWDERHAPRVYAGQVEYGEALREFLAGQALSPGQIEELLSAEKSWQAKQPLPWRPLTGLYESLRQLMGRGALLAAAGNSRYPAAALRESQLDPRLASLVPSIATSVDLAEVAPSARFFETVARVVGASRGEAAIISGDRDWLIGARQAGMLAVALHAPVDADADVVLARPRELLSLWPASAAVAA